MQRSVPAHSVSSVECVPSLQHTHTDHETDQEQKHWAINLQSYANAGSTTLVTMSVFVCWQ